MCGIAGLWTDAQAGAPSQQTVEQMIASLAHRGPDGRGFVTSGQGVLGHARLAIMDPARGKQPLFSETGALKLVSNGEFYNWQEIRRGLEPAHTFRTKSDSEVALHLFEDLETGAVAKLDGMFALALSDGERLLLARDPIGIKPLYYGHDAGGTLYFASEMKALTGVCETLETLPPGTMLDSHTGVRRYYHLPDHALDERPVAALVAEVRAQLEQAVSSHLMSDVPLGAFLSGGLDSSIIVALAKRELGELHTFAVGTEHSPNLAAARLVADDVGTTHHEYVLTPGEVLAHLPDIVYGLESFDRDVVRSVIPTYFTARLAREHVKVVLTGEGADELFAGYRYHQDYTDPAALHAELRRSLGAMHNVNLQRVDRMTMIHGLEARVPFLSRAVIDLALRIPPEHKLPTDRAGRRVEKWVLRKAFEDMLPAEIVWRDKAQFDEGSGTVAMIDEVVKEATRTLDLERYRAAHPGVTLRSVEECYYHKLFTEAFDKPALVAGNVGRWLA